MIDGIIWIAAGLALLIVEMLLPGVFMMWLGLAACGAGVLTLAFDFAFGGQVVAFGVLTAVALAAGLRTRRSQVPAMTNETAGLIGRPATALVFHGRDGRVRVGDSDWPARLPPDVAPPDPGGRMRVEAVEGTALIVRPERPTRAEGTS